MVFVVDVIAINKKKKKNRKTESTTENYHLPIGVILYLGNGFIFSRHIGAI